MSKHENGQLSIDFVVVFVGGLPNQPDRFGPIDVAYRVESTDGAFLDATEANPQGWFNYPLGAFLYDITPQAGLSPWTMPEPGQYAYRMLDASHEIFVFNGQRSANGDRLLGDLITLSDAEWRIEGAELVGTQQAFFPYPGRYEGTVTVHYSNGWQATSPVFRVTVRGDSDGDGVEDIRDPDSDNDGVCDGPDARINICEAGPDAFPKNPWQSQDRRRWVGDDR